MKKVQLNVRVSPVFAEFVDKVIEVEKERGYVVTKGNIIEDALQLYAADYKKRFSDLDLFDSEKS